MKIEFMLRLIRYFNLLIVKVILMLQDWACCSQNDKNEETVDGQRNIQFHSNSYPILLMKSHWITFFFFFKIFFFFCWLFLLHQWIWNCCEQATLHEANMGNEIFFAFFFLLSVFRQTTWLFFHWKRWKGKRIKIMIEGEWWSGWE